MVIFEVSIIVYLGGGVQLQLRRADFTGGMLISQESTNILIFKS